MTLLDWLFGSALVQRLGWTLLQSLWQDAAVALALAAVLWVLGRSGPQARYLAGCGALLLMAVLPLATFALTDAPQATSPAARPAQGVGAAVATVDGIAAEPRRSAATSEQTQLEGTGLRPQPASQTISPDSVAPIHPTASKPGSSGAGVATISLLRRALPWVVLTWAAGVLLMSLWNLGGWMAVRQLHKVAVQPAGEEIQRLLAPLVKQLGLHRPVRLLHSTLTQTPLVIGMVQPIILLPASVLGELSVAELQSILAHELVHVRRHDYLINLLQSLIENLLFYHPAVWWVSRRIRIERENCCDDLVLGLTRDRDTYARALAAVASVRLPSLAPSASGGRLLTRLRRIAGTGEADSVGLSRWLAGAAVILLCVGGAFLAIRSATAAGDDKHDIQAEPTGDVVHVRGRVLDAEDHPIARAEVLVLGDPWTFHAPLSTTETREDGTFEASFKKSQFNGVYTPWQSTVIAAMKPGFAPAWSRWNAVDPHGQVALRLPADDITIEGRILNLEGRPVPGARVTLHHLEPDAPDLESLGLGGVDQSQERGLRTPPIGGYTFGAAQSVTTAPDGRFRMPHLGRNRTANLLIEGPQIVFSSIHVLTRPSRRQTRTFQYDVAALPGTETTYGSTFEFTAVASRMVQGTVRDASTGKPLAGVVVTPDRNTCNGPYFGLLRTTTDALGHYLLDGLPRKKGVRVTAMPNDTQPYFMRDLPVPDAGGFAPVTVDFDLHRGVWISGKVTDLRAGQPAFARITYQPFLTNSYAGELPEFHERPQREIPGPTDRFETKPDGTYRVVAMPGPAIIAATFPKGHYVSGVGAADIHCPIDPYGFLQVYEPRLRAQGAAAIKEINLPDPASDTTVDLELDPGETVHVSIVDLAGKPLTGVLVAPPESYWGALTSPTFDASGLRIDESRMYWLRYGAGNLGKAITICPRDLPDRKLTVKLEPLGTLAGRLIAPDGQPLADGAIYVDPTLMVSASDRQGRFRFTVLPGSEFSLYCVKNGRPFFSDVQHVRTEPGVVRDLGDIHLTTTQPKAPKPAEKPATQTAHPVAVANDVVRVRGRVLDPDGKPQAGARILAFGNAWETDHPLSESRSAANGEFEIAFRKSQFEQKLGQWKNTGIVALTPGLPPAWARWDQVDAAGQVVLKLTRQDVPIEGRILNTEGRGIPGVGVRLRAVEAKAVDLTKLNASEMDESEVPRVHPPPLPAYASGLPTVVTTDLNGRFKIEGVGSDRTVSFDLGGPSIAWSSIDVVTRDVQRVSRKFQRYIEITETTYGAKFDFTAVPERVVRGTVTESATGKPLEGFTVEPNVWTDNLRTTTDGRGRFEIHGLAKDQNVRLRVLPPPGDPYLVGEAQIPTLAGYAPVVIDFKLERGIWITGKVTELGTGLPVGGAQVRYRPYLTNAYAQHSAEFAQNRVTEPFAGYQTDASGRYRMVGVPGPALVVVAWTHQPYRAATGAKDVKCPMNPPGSFYLTFQPLVYPAFVKAIKEIDIPPRVQTTNVDFQLDPGITIHVTAMEAGEKPVSDITAIGHRPGFGLERISGARFDAVAFSPHEQRQVMVWNPRRRIGKVVTVRPGDVPDRKLTITLEPWSEVSGRLIGPDGQPVANARIEPEVDYVFPGGTDAQGRFRIRLLPGLDCSLRGIKGRDEFNTDAQKVPIKPGETKDLGDVHMKSFS